MKRIFLFLALLFLVFSSCSKNDSDQEIFQVRYGTFFGECFGYCKYEMTLELGSVIYKKEEFYDSTEKVICSESLNDEIWNSIMDLNRIDAFFDLPETIGCPDCADGGGEWVEIQLVNGNKHKVVFEYFNEPEILKKYTVVLRNQMDKAEDCEEF